MNFWVGDYSRRGLIRERLISKFDIFLKCRQKSRHNFVNENHKKAISQTKSYRPDDFFIVITYVTFLSAFLSLLKGSNTQGRRTHRGQRGQPSTLVNMPLQVYRAITIYYYHICLSVGEIILRINHVRYISTV